MQICRQPIIILTMLILQKFASLFDKYNRNFHGLFIQETIAFDVRNIEFTIIVSELSTQDTRFT